MELSISARARRAAKTAAPQPKTSAKTPSAPSKALQNKLDRLEVSRQALAMLEEQNRQAQAERQRKLEEQKRSSSGELDAVTKALKTMQKCQKIAARIMAGDKVPPEDERYLMDNDPEGYKLALAMRRPKKDPKEWDSVLEDEDKDGGGSDGGESVEASDPGGGTESAPTE